MAENTLRRKVLTGMFWRFSERICAQLVTFVVSIVLARILDPSHYGIISMITIFITIANVFVTDSFGKALVQKKDANSADFSSVFYFNILFSWIVYAVVYVIAPYIASFYNEPLLTPTMRVLALQLPLAGVNSVQQAYVSKNMLFKRFFWSTLIGTVVSGFVGIGMAVAGLGVWALVGQSLTNSVMDTVVLWFTVRWRPTREWSWKKLTELLSFGWKVLLTSLVNSLYDNLRSFIIGKSYTSADLAFYTKGIHYPSLVITTVNTSIGSVLFPAMSKLQDDKDRLKRSVRKSISVSTFVIFPLMALLAAVAPNLISWMLTDKWLPCVPFLQIACIYLAFYPINTANLQAIIALGRSDVYLKLNIIKKIIGVVCVLISLPFGVTILAGSEIIVGIAAVTTNISANKKLLNYSAKDLFDDVYKSALLSILMVVGISALEHYLLLIISSSFMRMMIEILFGSGFYLIGSIILKSEELNYVVKILKK